MRSILERLLLLLTPLFAVAATSKKTTAKKKPARTQPKAERTRTAKKPASRVARAPVAKSKAKVTARGTKASAKEQEPPAAKPATPKAPPGPPAPKPPAPIGRAILLIPENGKYADNVHPTFRWLSVGGATRYEVAWSEDPGLSGTHPMVSPATEATVPADRALRVNATYYWRVRGGNEGGWGPWSPVSSFQVLEAPPVP